MNNLTGMMVFAQVIQSGSFSKAADDLGMSKSSVSKKVSYLEDRLGVRLLNRTTRKLSLTEVGQVFYERCERIMSEAQEAELAITRLQDEPRGQLKISAPVSFGVKHLGKPLTAFATQYSDLSIDIQLNDRFVDIVDEGFDLAIRIGHLSDSSLIAKKIGSSRLVACASPEYWEENGKPTHPKDLLDHNCLLYTLARSAISWPYKENGKDYSVKLDGTFKANNGNVISDMAIAGAGVCVSPAFIVGSAITDGRLICALEEYEKEPVNIYAVYPHNRHLSAKVRLFVDFLKNWFSKCPSWEHID
ncbi:Transcriptional regulator [Candidatus Terasakiella magnetica]|uniref:Transcriptional regulator n=1 Tax=Candidatus Terasakiella magnetica TaxID=1867952 RepID=A0A1C3RM69_9PROT|nr:LysR family transcriptional regulator [Candidatus Terasakiella magnetica]SCA58219.1 Transcriptional regulator [Candidatus Terasakiella magnetica]